MDTLSIKEVIKALSYGNSVELIAEIEDISESEVRSIAEQYAADVENMKKYHAEMEG